MNIAEADKLREEGYECEICAEVPVFLQAGKRRPVL